MHPEKKFYEKGQREGKRVDLTLVGSELDGWMGIGVLATFTGLVVGMHIRSRRTIRGKLQKQKRRCPPSFYQSSNADSRGLVGVADPSRHSTVGGSISWYNIN